MAQSCGTVLALPLSVPGYTTVAIGYSHIYIVHLHIAPLHPPLHSTQLPMGYLGPMCIALPREPSFGTRGATGQVVSP